MKKRFFAILLCLVMIVGLLPTGALAAQTADGDNVFHKTELLEAGREYLIVAKSGSGKIYAMTAAEGGGLSKVEVEVDGDAITYDGTDAVWNIASAGDKFHLKYGDQYLNGKDQKFTLAEEPIADRYWVYENGSLVYNGNYYLTYVSSYSGSHFGYKSSGTVDIYVRGEAHDVVCTHEKAQAFTAKAASCTEAGNIAYWYCPDCGKYFSDEGLTEVISESATVTKALGHDLGEWTVVKEATTTATGTQKRECSRCDYSETREYGPIATYQLTDTLVEGKEYLIVSANAGSAFALKNESGSGYMMTGSEATITSDQKIQFADNTAVWTCGKNDNGLTLTNGTAFLTGHGGGLTTGSASDVAKRAWSYDSDQLIITSSTGSAYVVYYSSGDKAFRAVKTSDETNGYKVYLFVKDDACTHANAKHEAAKDATCSATGNLEYWYCADCETYFSDAACTKETTLKDVTIAVNPDAHKWDEGKVTTDPTCTEEGVMTFTCEYDKTHTKTAPIEATGHKWGDWEVTKPATEEAVGEETRVCQNDKTHVEHRDIPKLNHVHSLTPVAKVEPSCTKPGSEACWQCSGCHKYFSDPEGETVIEAPVEIPMVAHKTELKNDKAATCTEAGYTGDEVCTVCHQTIEEGKEIPAKGHDWDEGKVTKAATCEAKGELTRTCKNDSDHIKIEDIPALGHKWDAGKVTKEATCETAGEMTYTCQNDKDHTKTEPIAAKGHTLVETPAKAPTATEAGNIRYWECSVCHKLFSDKDGKTEIKLEDTVLPATGETPAESNVFVLTSKLEAGKNYLIVNTDQNGDAYVLVKDGSSLSKVAVKIVDGKITLDNSNAIWAASKDDNNDLHFKIGSSVLDCTYNQNTNDGMLRLVDVSNLGSGRNWSYEDSQLQCVTKRTGGQNEYKIYFINSSDGFGAKYISSSSSSFTEKVYLFSNDGSSEPVNPPEPQDGTTYVLTDKLVDGKEYLIVSANSGSAYALTNPGGSANGVSMGSTAVKIVDGKIVLDNAAAVWTVTASGTYFNITNGNDYLEGKSGKVSIFNKLNYSNRGWAYTDGQLQHKGGDNTYTVYYDSDAFTSAYKETTAKVYLFEKVDGSVTPPEECTHAKLTKHDATDSTCAEAGHDAYWECANCGQLFSDAEGENAIDKPVEKALAAHKLSKVEKVDPTCAKAGAEEHWKCDVCGKLFSDADGKNEISAPVEIKKLDHTIELKDDKDPTCTEKGYTGDEVCSVCGEVVKKGSEIAALGHTPELKDKKEATCEEKGYSGDYYCSVCGELIAKGNEVDALGHKWDEGKVTTEPTCTEEGVMTFTCEHDKTHTYTEPIEALGHKWSDWKVTIPATETEGGYEARTCSVCGERETREIPPVTHKHQLVAVAKVEPTCETAGSEACWQCEGCHKYFSDAEGKVEIEAPVAIAALGHDTEIRGAKDPTCAAEGYTGDTYCKRCDKLISEGKPIAKLAHQWGEWVVTTPATETTEGVQTRTCSVCGEKETRAIPVLTHEHTLVAVNGVAATCEDAGFEPYWKCTDCSRLFSDAEGKHEIEAPVVIAALGHKLVKHDAKAPTATAPGNIEYWECSVCHKLFADAEGKTEIKLEDTVLQPVKPEKCDGGDKCPSIILTDVDRSPTSWYHEAVDWAYVNEITKGSSTTKFSPNAECTREQMVTFLWRAMNMPKATITSCPFTDVNPGAYSYAAILWAYENEIINGTAKDKFSPSAPVTREQVVTILWRLAKSPSVEGKMPFSDVNAGYSFDAIRWAAANNVTTGYPDGTFRPTKSVSRAEIVTLLYRYLVP